MNEDNKTLKQELAVKITEYFILEKRWLRNKGRTILFGEDDSERLFNLILKAVRDRLPEEITMKNMVLNGSVRCDGRYNQALTEVREILGGNDE